MKVSFGRNSGSAPAPVLAGAGSAPDWIVRGVAMAAVVVAVRVLLGFWMRGWPTHTEAPRILMYVVVLACAAAWGVSDGRRDRMQFAEPEDGADLTMLWLKAAAVGALLSGLATWLFGRLPTIDVGGNSLWFELSSGASFILLTIFLAALAGVAFGRYRVGKALATS